jgi:pyrimidine-nucleoside phosphorylase
MRALDLILTKRDGGALDDAAIEFFVAGLCRGEIPDYQATALLMAIHCRGLDLDECTALTGAIVRSGRVLDFADLGPVVDKHSTGGVGDTVSLIAAPLAAAAGVIVPMISGRALGHTGGTLDKLAAIPGLRTDLDPAAFRRAVAAAGLAIVEAGPELAPGDQVLYRLRDASGTVPDPSLITASILGKKLCVTPRGLVMDVKVGGGTFLRARAAADALVARMGDVARRSGLAVRFVLSAMDEPLSPAIGNAIEIERAIRVLRGEVHGPLCELSLVIAGEMIALAALARDGAAGRARAAALLARGEGADRFARFVAAQGGDATTVDHPERLPRAAVTRSVRAERSGFVGPLDARALGAGAALLGCGRGALGSTVDPAAGMLVMVAREGAVRAGDEIALLHAASEARIAAAVPLVAAAIPIGDAPPPSGPTSPLLAVMSN